MYNLYGRLNIFLYRHDIHYYNSWGMWRAIDLRSESALLKFIEKGANPCAMERMGRSLYYNRYIPHEEYADEKDEPGTEEIADVARQYEYQHQGSIGKEPGKSISGDHESDTNVSSSESNKRPIPPYRRPPRDPPICAAAQAGHIGVLKILLAHGANPNARSYNNRTPLIDATILSMQRRSHCY